MRYPSKMKPTSLPFYALLALAVLLEVSADILFKKWSLDGRRILFVAGMLIYAIGTAFWAFSLRQEVLSKAITIFTIANLILVVLVGVILFKEKLTLSNALGISLGIVSVYLMEI